MQFPLPLLDRVAHLIIMGVQGAHSLPQHLTALPEKISQLLQAGGPSMHKGSAPISNEEILVFFEMVQKLKKENDLLQTRIAQLESQLISLSAQ